MCGFFPPFLFVIVKIKLYKGSKSFVACKASCFVDLSIVYNFQSSVKAGSMSSTDLMSHHSTGNRVQQLRLFSGGVD